MTRSPCEKCTHKMTPKNEMPCAACPDPAEYAESLGHASLPTRTIKELVKVQPYKPAIKEPEAMSILKKVFKPCPGPLHNGENLPLDKFSKSTVSVDGRSKLCIECQKKELSDMPLKEKKTRGCPPGGWPKKEIKRDSPNIPDWINGKIDHPSKPLPEIPKNKPEPIPESVPSQNIPLKFDLSAFEKITTERRISEKPTVRIGKDNEIAFNMQAAKQFGLVGKRSMDIHIKRGGMASQVAFLPISGDNGTVKLHNLPSYCYFNSAVVVRKINAKPGKYEIIEEGGVLFIVTTNKDGKK